MAGLDPTGTPWKADEIALIVADYFEMLQLDSTGQHFVKAHRNAELQNLTRRSRTSIEMKHQNISAVLMKLGIPWLRGYAPLANYQEALVAEVEKRLVSNPALLAIEATRAKAGLMEAEQLFLEAPPEVANDDRTPEYLKRLVRKFDPAVRDERNRSLGRAGEEAVVLSEQARLRQEGRADLAGKVRWVADLDGDGAGYDVMSFHSDGRPALLEVKTTNGGKTTPFFLSENERSLSEEQPDAFQIVRLYDFSRKPRGFSISPPLESAVILSPSIWKAGFG
ncbi:MAG: DUF3883 domain-containing protein [Burkholderiales bacterium]|nr:MAG: DUF3883 domain-containing protein [Burkholderiales bacterium]